MNSRKQFLLSICGGMMLAAMMACSGDNETTGKSDDGVRVRRLTITETDNSTAGARQMPTRATLTDNGDIDASWTAGDGLTYCNLSRTKDADGDEIYSGSLTAVSTAAISQFTGNVECIAGDYLAVVYPATSFSTNTSYTISLTGQDGTLSTLATSYHYVYGKAQVTSVTDATADATMPKMKSLLTVCKFSFIDRASSSPIPIKMLSISYGGSSSDVGTYPQSAKVTIKENSTIKEQADVHTLGVASSKALTVTCPSEQSEAYVALLPTTAQRTFSFSVSDGSGNTYTGTATATLTEGEYMEATRLKLTKQ